MYEIRFDWVLPEALLGAAEGKVKGTSVWDG